MVSEHVAKKMDVLKILFSYFSCSQIWLNPPLDHGHFGYITKN
jgi:hypothetical protein